ncbi:MAG: ABC transporter permease [Acidimicrobiales bacterium]|jgi:ABC-2 type transport system permease protein
MIAVEFAKQVRRVRTWVVAAICIVIPFLIGLGFELGGNNNANGGNGLNFVTHQSGIVIGIFALSFSSVLLIPIVFAIFAGEPIASEARWGSLRYLLVRPVTRPRVLGSKLGVSIVLAVGTTLLIPITGTIVGIAFFGLHPVHTFGIGTGSYVSGSSVVTLPIASALGRLLLATAYTLFSMLSVVGIATLVGVATENALAAMSSGIGLYIVSAILDALSGLSRIHPLLPVHYLEAWTNLFVPGTSLQGMLHGVISAGIWGVVPLLLAFRVFQRKDVLC